MRCQKCQKEDAVFYLRSNSKIRTPCIECCQQARKNRYLQNKQQEDTRNKRYNAEHKEQLKAYHETWYSENKEHVRDIGKVYRKNNKDKINQKNAKYRKANSDKIKQYHKKYYTNNKKIIRLKSNQKERDKRTSDPIFRLRKNISRDINCMLTFLGKKKNASCLKYLPYSIQDLKQHLESKFEPWMNWNNHGTYTRNYDDLDQSTWKWSIDHIIPQSKLPYTSMEEDNFKKCWALENLRPLSAKQNHHDGCTKIRH